MVKTKNIEILDKDDDEDSGFIDGAVDVGNVIMSFSFAPAAIPQTAAFSKVPSSSTGKMFFNVSQRGSTPMIDGEAFTLKRCYQYRPSTLRKLNELKASHSDVNVYLNTIIDEAITYYYEHVLSRKTTS